MEHFFSYKTAKPFLHNITALILTLTIERLVEGARVTSDFWILMNETKTPH